MKEQYIIFGSKSSQDYDVLVLVDKITTDIRINSSRCKKYEDLLKEILPDKKINCNLGIAKSGIITCVYKGTADEVNNVLYYTYDNHKQHFPNPVKRIIERDVQLKMLRTCRVLLSFLSRSIMRPEVKLALRSDLKKKIETLRKIDYTKADSFVEKRHVKIEDFWKVIAFQLGQTLALMDGIEYYSKEEILKAFPEFENALKRNVITEEDKIEIEKKKTLLLDRIEKIISEFTSLVEY
jgi:hypothetical protein